MTEEAKARSCETRIDAELASSLTDLARLWNQWCEGAEPDPDLGRLEDYALGFDYVAPETFDDQPEGYFRYQLSLGGPSDEFRFFVNPDLSCHRIEYWFMDWFDGASRILSGEDFQLMREIFDWLKEGVTLPPAAP
jgi:hypothetical protein